MSLSTKLSLLHVIEKTGNFYFSTLSINAIGKAQIS